MPKGHQKMVPVNPLSSAGGSTASPNKCGSTAAYLYEPLVRYIFVFRSLCFSLSKDPIG